MSGIAAPILSGEQATKILQALKGRLKSVRIGPQHLPPGTAMLAKVLPTATEIDASDLVNAAIDIAGVTKDVLFADANAVATSFTDPSPGGTAQSFDGFTALKRTVGAMVAKPPTVEGGKPFAAPAAIGGLPTAVTTHVPGLIAQLFGTVQAPSLKVGIDLQWTVCDESGVPMQEGRDFIATGGLTSPEVNILIAPPGARELRVDTLTNPGGKTVCLWLSVTLTLGAAPPLTFDLPPLPFVRLPLLVPSFVALFNEPNFEVTHDSAVLLVVPEGSPLSSLEPLFKTLKSLEAATSALRSIGGMAGFFLGLDEVLGAIPNQPRIRFATAKQGENNPREKSHNVLADLRKITIKRRPWYDLLGSDKTFNDTVRSLLLFGGPGLEVEFFNSTNFKDPGQGWFRVKLNDTITTTGALLPDCFVAIRSLYVDDQKPPSTVPPGRASPGSPGIEDQYSWDKDMSSLQFSAAYMRAVAADENVVQTGTVATCAPRQVPAEPPSPPVAGRGDGGGKRGKGRNGRGDKASG